MVGGPARTLSHEVTDAFRVVIACAVAMVAVIAVALSWFCVDGQVRLDHAAKVVALSRDVSTGLQGEQSMLRAYVMTGDRSALTSYPDLRARINTDVMQLIGLADHQQVTLAQRLGQASEDWQRDWATPALAPATREQLLANNHRDLHSKQVAAFIRSGGPSFAAAEAAADQLIDGATDAQRRTRDTAFFAVVLTGALLLALGGVATVALLGRRRRIQARVIGPIGALLEKVRAVGRGEFGASPVIDAPQELLELRDELADMSASLKLQQQALAARADEAAASAKRMKLVVEFAREISDSLTLSNVLGALTLSGRRLVGSPRSRVWLYDADDRVLRLRYDSITGDVVRAMTHDLTGGSLGRAIQNRRLTYSGGLTGETEMSAKALAVAVPLVKGSRLIGVLEVALRPGASWLDIDTIDVLTATAGHAATAIHAAQLFAQSESLSRSDALTGLANRRQLDADLELEVERAARYRRPMSFLMIDIDHFKRVNDTFGHGLGDSVLVEVATVLRGHMRAGDTAYRYGGEEFAVLARETDSAGARVIAERLRSAIEERYAATHEDELAVTVSIGLVTTDSDASDVDEVVSAADKALYSAKRAGRNCVRIAPTGQAPARGHAAAHGGAVIHAFG